MLITVDVSRIVSKLTVPSLNIIITDYPFTDNHNAKTMPIPLNSVHDVNC